MSKIVHIPLAAREIMECFERVYHKNYIDNLRFRHPLVALDSKIRGAIGEYAFKKWLGSHGIKLSTNNQYDPIHQVDADFIYHDGGKDIIIELKTSLIPDQDETIAEMIKKRDVKLIYRRNQKIEELHGDIHVQMVFKQLRLRKDQWLKRKHFDESYTIEEWYQKLALFRYETDVFLIAWIDKETLIRQIKRKANHRRIWSYGQRQFWTCSLTKEAKNPLSLINYLNQL